uniref:Uncharacterized protein n=1 Tax=Brassica oleracea TaxID=3712 RepID=A0A3P6BC32_BRAOL|nr:unnamed protein product [Brassica oleracea]
MWSMPSKSWNQTSQRTHCNRWPSVFSTFVLVKIKKLVKFFWSSLQFMTTLRQMPYWNWPMSLSGD